MLRFMLVGLPLMISSAALAERLQKCPIDSLDQTEIATAITAAASCAQSYEVMNVCRSNAGGDVALSEIVIQKCEQVFLANLQPLPLKAYQAARDSCARRFAQKESAANASFRATCEAGVAVVFAHRADLEAMRPRRPPGVPLRQRLN
ncbi:MAG: hypothetical protein WDN46_12815 [Methylocella sp.]